MDFGASVDQRHVVELPGDKPFPGHGKGALAGLRAFTLAGWISVRGGAMGPGGDRVINYCNGGGGIDLVWDSGGGGRLKLAVR
jgi:hypothetical protein